MKFYHGCNKNLTQLKAGTYVTKSIRDAQKFGYRRAVMEHSAHVYIMELDIDIKNLSRDKTRDRAYQLTQDSDCRMVEYYLTFDTPNKLKEFKK